MGRRGREPPPAGAGVGGQPAPADDSPPRAGSEAESRERPGPQEAERLPPVPRRGGLRRARCRCGRLGRRILPSPRLLKAPLPPPSDTQRNERPAPPAGSGEARRRARGAQRRGAAAPPDPARPAELGAALPGAAPPARPGPAAPSAQRRAAPPAAGIPPLRLKRGGKDGAGRCRGKGFPAVGNGQRRIRGLT